MREGFEAQWERCAVWLQSALDAGPNTHTLEDVKGCVERGSAQFWAGRASAIVTEFVDYPQVKTLNFWLAGGDLDELRDEMRPQIEAYAKANGAKFVTIVGRAGWARALGYQPLHVTCSKEL